MTIQEIILDETINGWYKDRPVSDILSVSAKRYKLQIEDIHDHKQNFLNYYKKDIEVSILKKELTESLNW